MPGRPSASRSGTSETHIALLRGINVGGKHKLPMSELAALFAEAGCDEVRTVIQSGNVVFRATQALTERIPALIADVIADRYGFRVPVVTRTAPEIREVARGNPFIAAGVDTGKLHVAFLADEPSPELIALLNPDRSPPDEFVASGREIYLHLPNGVARTKFTNDYFDRTLGTTSTIRNWRTLLMLLELAEAT